MQVPSTQISTNVQVPLHGSSAQPRLAGYHRLLPQTSRRATSVESHTAESGCSWVVTRLAESDAEEHVACAPCHTALETRWEQYDRMRVEHYEWRTRDAPTQTPPTQTSVAVQVPSQGSNAAQPRHLLEPHPDPVMTRDFCRAARNGVTGDCKGRGGVRKQAPAKHVSFSVQVPLQRSFAARTQLWSKPNIVLWIMHAVAGSG